MNLSLGQSPSRGPPGTRVVTECLNGNPTLFVYLSFKNLLTDNLPSYLYLLIRLVTLLNLLDPRSEPPSMNIRVVEPSGSVLLTNLCPQALDGPVASFWSRIFI